MGEILDILKHGMKWVVLEKWTITKIKLTLLVIFSKPKMKSIITYSQGLLGTDKGVYKPVF